MLLGTLQRGAQIFPLQDLIGRFWTELACGLIGDHGNVSDGGKINSEEAAMILAVTHDSVKVFCGLQSAVGAFLLNLYVITSRDNSNDFLMLHVYQREGPVTLLYILRKSDRSMKYEF